jgi:WD40 repeat protein
MAETPSREERLNEVIAEYLEAAEGGRAPGRDEWLAAHPELAGELAAFLDNHDRLAAAAAPLRADPDATLPPAPTLAPDAPGADAPGAPLGTVRYFGDYELLAEIARGGMGVVFRARQVSLGREVALKMILAGQLASPADVARFRAEAEAAANLDHPNILPIYEVGEHAGQQYFSMKLIDGGSLADRFVLLRRSGQNTSHLRGDVALLATVARAVHHAHQRGVLHRDLKPGNVLLDAGGTPYVTDFGLAKRVEGGGGLTQSGAIVGTPAYMPPEQARAEKQVTTAADVYALGAILYELLTGRPPFHGDTPLDTVLQVLDREPPRPRALDPRTDRDLETVALKCLEKEPAKRYDSAAALADDLERWHRGEPIAARSVGRAERAWRWCRRNPALAGLTAALAVTLVAGTVVSVVFARAAVRKDAEASEASAEARAQQAAAAAARGQAEAEAAKAKRLAAQAEQTLYFHRTALAQQYWRGANIAQADRILALCPPELRGWEWRYLHRVGHADLLTLPGNGQFTVSLSVSRDGQRLAAIATSGDSGARIWDLTTNKPLAEVRHTQVQPRTQFTAGALSPDGATLALGDQAGAVTLWDAATGRKKRDLGRLSSRVGRLSFHPAAGRLGAFGEKGFKVWDQATGREQVSRADGVVADFLPDGRHLLVAQPAASLLPGQGELRLKLWDAESLEERRDLGRQIGTAWSATPVLLALRGRDYFNTPRVRVIEIATGTEVFATAPDGPSGDVALHPDGSLLASANKFGTAIQVWDLKEKLLRYTLRGHTGWINAVEFLPDGRLASCAWDKTIKFWEPAAAIEFTRRPGRAAEIVSAAAYSPDGTRLAAVQGDSVGTPLLAVVLLGNPLLGNPGTAVTVWDPTAGRAVQTLRGHTDGARRVTYAADGRRLASAGRDGRVIVWDCATGKAVANWRGHDGWVEGLAVSPDGNWVASSHEPKEVTEARFGQRPYKAMPGEAKVWDAATGKERFTLGGHPSTVYRLAFSPDGRLVLSASNQLIKLWDAATGAERGRLEGPQAAGTNGLVFSRDGKTLATATGADRAIHLWDLGARAVRCALVGHGDGPFGGVAFSPDGRRVATAVGHEVKLWDAATGQEVLTLPLPELAPNRPSGVRALAFSPDGRTLQAAIHDGTCIAWDAPPAP